MPLLKRGALLPKNNWLLKPGRFEAAAAGSIVALRASCEYSGRAGTRCGDSTSISRLGGLPPRGALHYQSVFCLSFATLPVFLDKTCAFDFTPAKTRLSLRGTGADEQSF